MSTPNDTPKRSPKQPNHKICAFCGVDFKVKPSHYDKTTYCSRECMAQDYRKILTGNRNPNYKDAATKFCLRCGAEYHSYNKTRKYCSLSCAAKVNNISAKQQKIALAPRKPRVRTGRNCVCRRCGTKFIADRKFVNCPNCQRMRAENSIHTCIVCGNQFKHYGSKKVCSPECLSIHRSVSQMGEKSHRWQGGKTEQVVLDRKRLTYKLWRTAVFERDDYVCQLCNKKGGRLAAHHIKLYSTHPELRYEVANGITLCWECHTSIKNKESEYELQFFKITGHVNGF